MALTLDGMIPAIGGSSSSGAALGAGGGILGGGVAGLIGGALAGGLMGNRNGGWGGYGNGYGAAPAATAIATDITLNPAFQSLQTQIQTLGGQVSNSGLMDQLQDLAIAQQQTSESVNTNLSGVTRDILSGQADLSTAIATANYTTLNSINNLGRDITAQSNQNALQQLNSFNQVNTTQLQGFNQAAFNQNIATQQIIAQGTAQSAAMAECCCQIKGAIAADGDATRQLINDLNVQNLRDQLAVANNQVSNNNQNQYLLSTILAHFKPTTGTTIV